MGWLSKWRRGGSNLETTAARHALASLLDEHGFPGSLHGDALRLANGWEIRCRVPQPFKAATAGDQGTLIAQIDAATPVLPARPIATIHSGYGPTAQAAIADALVDWQHRVFLPVADALAGARNPDGRMTTTTTLKDGSVRERQWELFEGSLGVMYMGRPGASATPPPDEVILGDQEMAGFAANPFATAVHELPGYPLHWIKIFLSHIEDGSRMAELLLDNVEWRDHSQLEAFQWPPHEGFLALRYFVCAVEPESLGRLPVPEATPN